MPEAGDASRRTAGPLAGLLVVDVATLFAGPMAAAILGDLGADVVKVEHPRGDPVRDHGAAKNGVPLWWLSLSRGKRTVSLDLHTPEGADLLLRLLGRADVLVENFRPGTLERWGLGPDLLHEVNPRLVIARVTGFGQHGPYASRPGFGTLAESMSGFAAATGQPDGPPTLPPFGLADGIAGQACANAVLAALYTRDSAAGQGRGQVVDVAIIEPILSVLGPQVTVYDQTGVVPPRTGNRSTNNAPRNVYRTRDGRWVAVSTSAGAVAERLLRLVGHEEVTREPWFATGRQRAQHTDELDAYVGEWVASRDLDDVVAAFEQAQAAAAPVYDVADVLADPQYAALGTIVTRQHDRLGPVRMVGPPYRLSLTPAAAGVVGRELGEDNDEVLGGWLGVPTDELARLAARGVVGRATASDGEAR